jgi:hypothetical protein
MDLKGTPVARYLVKATNFTRLPRAVSLLDTYGDVQMLAPFWKRRHAPDMHEVKIPYGSILDDVTDAELAAFGDLFELIEE